MAAKQGPNVLFCMPSRAKCILLVPSHVRVPGALRGRGGGHGLPVAQQHRRPKAGAPGRRGCRPRCARSVHRSAAGAPRSGLAQDTVCLSLDTLSVWRWAAALSRTRIQEISFGAQGRNGLRSLTAPQEEYLQS
jgi:hypothetical protein